MTSPLANILLWGAASHALAILCVGITLGMVGLLKDDSRLEEAASLVTFRTLVGMLVVTAVGVSGRILGVW